MNKPNYPSPCLNCEKADEHRVCGAGSIKGCNEWRKWFLWWWKYFGKSAFVPKKKNEKFTYEHPDIIRQIRENKPCDKCPSLDCDIPCSDYEAWFVAKWDYDRKSVSG